MVEKHFLRQRGALPQAQQLEDPIFLTCQMQRATIDLDQTSIEIDDELADPDDRVGMSFGTPDDCMDPRDQFATIERLSQKVIGAEPEALQFVVEFGKTRKDQDRSAN